MRNFTLLIFLWLISGHTLSAQMWNGTDTVFGNEWIRYGQPYFKILVANDGIYRIPYSTLAEQGVPVENVAGAQFQLFRLGEEVPLYTTTEGIFGVNDFIEFFGARNRGELDRHLYRNPDTEMLNPLYSIATDTSAYFLTWAVPGAPTQRYQTINNDLSNPPPKEEWFWHELLTEFGGAVAKKTDSQDVAESHFGEGEGLSTGFITSRTINFSPAFSQPVAASARFRLRMFSNNRPHDLRITVNGASFYNETFNGYRLHEVPFEKPASSLAATEQVVLTGAASNNDRHALAWASLTYPREFNFGNQNAFAFRIAASAQAKYLEISNFNSGSTAPVLYDLNNGARMTASLDGNLVRLLLLPSAAERSLFLVNPNTGVRLVSAMQPLTFTDYSNADREYIIISHPRLYDDGNGGNPVQEYADYRDSEAGGSYRTIVLNVEELYDQFAYGVHRHPLSIRNAVHRFVRQWSEPKYVLLIGKGRQYDVGRAAAQVAGTFFVPTFGMPGSDNLLIASNYTNVPILPIGRIAASTPADVRLYFDKVVIHENEAASPLETEREWKKEVAHLGGGGDASEQQFIKSALGQMENIVRNSAMGANVHSFYKTNSDPVQQSVSDALTRRINEGVSIFTIFGHSSPQGFDVAVDNPANYLNSGRYPALFSLGCYSGEIHKAPVSVGERFLFQEDKGALAFLATIGQGYISVLSTFAQAYFNHLGNSHYGRGLGDVMQHSIRQFDNTGSFPLRALLQQFTLQGDPALVITPLPQPDLLLRTAEAAVEPRNPNAQLDSVELRVVVRNIGKAVPDSCFIEIIRELPDGTELLALRQRIRVPRFSDRHAFRLPVLGSRAAGLNRFKVNLDTDNEIEEGPEPFAEQNNAMVNDQGREGIEFFVFANGAIPLYPSEFGIASSAPVTLKASSADLLVPEQKYIFEIDTTQQFNSPALQRGEVVQRGGLLQWTPNLYWSDSTVYYWRVSTDSVPGVGYNWRGSSFIYIAGSPPGWNQSHFFQWLDNAFLSMQIPEDSRRLQFLDDLKTIRIKNAVFPFPNFQIGLDIDNLPFDYHAGSVQGGINIFALDSITLNPWMMNIRPGLFGSRQPVNWPIADFPYWTRTPEERLNAINFLRDIIPSGNYVIIYTIQRSNASYMPQDWAADSLQLGTNLFQVLEEQGAQLIRSTAETGPRPYVLMYKKDDPSWPVVERLGELNEPLVETVYLTGRWDRGEVRPPRVGPAQSWASLHWKIADTDPSDDWSLDVYGIRPDSSEVLLMPNLTVSDTTLGSLDAGQFPFLQLRFRAADTLLRTAPHIPYWRVLYEGLPDAVLDPAAAFHFHKDTLQQGEPLSLQVAVSNATPLGMDSLLVRFTIADPAGNRHIFQRRLAPLPPNDTLIAHLHADTRNLSGLQQLRIEVNPDRDQPELYDFNNTGIKDFFVQKDLRNPLVDVTFDGRRIMDGEIVSARPVISITLRDENPWLRLQDTSLFNVLLRYPGAADVTPVPLSADYVRFVPAGSGAGSDNRALLELSPHFTESGTYALTVQGRDASGNASGELDFRVSFEVITEARISNVLNYPNPFTTSTRFVYTLTGEEAPTFFNIRIMTVSGRIVRELTQDELGPLRIGAHQTDYAWDGTDMYGDRLANGVYLYQVFAKDREGKDLVKHGTGADAFFKNSIGKLVLLR